MAKPITVLFDANPLATPTKSGVGYYTYGLIDALAKKYPNDVVLIGHYFNFLGRKKPDMPVHPNIRYRTSVLIPGKVLGALRRVGLQLPFELLIKSRGDIALFPNFVTLPTLQRIKKAVVLHDLCFEDHPEYLQPKNVSFLKRFVPGSVRSANLIISISNSTKGSIIKHYGVSEQKILITPIAPPTAEAKSVAASADIPKKYILFVSTLEPRKNYLSLVEAYAMLPKNLREEYGLVLMGMPGWQTDEPLSKIEKLKSQGFNIALTGYVDEPTRVSLYQNASALAMPSHYEGFGMPILEAMSYGIPVAVSDIPVFHEVAGGAALYFDKDDADDIARKLEELLTDKNIRSQLIKNSRGQLKKYSWGEVADSVIKRFRGMVDG